MTKLPKPETRIALLYNEAVRDWTWHKYLETRECIISGVNGGDGFEFIFECSETGFERRWGYELKEQDVSVAVEEEGN